MYDYEFLIELLSVVDPSKFDLMVELVKAASQ